MYIIKALIPPFQHKNKQLVFRALFLLGCAVVSFSCRDNGKEKPHEAMQKYSNPDTLKLIVDLSESMKGFVHADSFKQLIGKTVTALGPNIPVAYYGLDNGLSKISDFLELFEPTKYNKKESDLHIACRAHNKESKNLLILITDLQFNDNRKYYNLVKTFQQKLLDGCYMKIFSSNPEFSGTIFPQFTGSARYNHTGKRPLYAIVLGKSEHWSYIEHILKKAMNWENSLTLTSNVALKSKILRSNARVSSNYKTVALKSRDSLFIIYKIYGTNISEWRNFKKEDIQTEICNSENKTSNSQETENLTIKKIKIVKDTITISFFIKEINPEPTKLIKLFIRPQFVPAWVVDQSCGISGDQATKSVKFKDFIEDVIGNQSNPFTLSAFEILLKK